MWKDEGSLTPQNNIMKAAEILQKHVSVWEDDLPWSQILAAMEEYAQQFQSPQISEEEIRAKIDEFLSNCSEFERSKFDSHVVEITHLDYSLLVDFIIGLSRLPHGQPVNNIYKLEAEQPQERGCPFDEELK